MNGVLLVYYVLDGWPHQVMRAILLAIPDGDVSNLSADGTRDNEGKASISLGHEPVLLPSLWGWYKMHSACLKCVWRLDPSSDKGHFAVCSRTGWQQYPWLTARGRTTAKP